MHVELYRRDDVGAIVHTHAPYATALACVLDEVPSLHDEAAALGGAVPIAPYLPAGSPELALAAARALEGRSAVLLANHGAVTVGAGLEQAIAHTELLERACALYWRAARLGFGAGEGVGA